MNTVKMMSYLTWCDVIKCGCDAFIGYMMLYIYGCDVIHKKGVISSNEWV